MERIASAISDSVNPFQRLVYAITADDGALNVAFFQMEQVKEASFQSEYGCDSVFKALQVQLASRSAVVVNKSLVLVRTLMLEGAPSFNGKIGGIAGRIQGIANGEAQRGTAEEHNKVLAQAIYKAINGDPGALRQVSSSGPGASGGGTAPAANDTKGGNYKSEFQSQQERELRAFKKRKEDEKKSSELVISEKLFEQFDSTQPPLKLVAGAANSAKKKFAPEELENFVAAALDSGKPSEVASALDDFLKDGKSTLQVRYKVLSLVDALVRTGNLEVLLYFRAHAAGVQRHLNVDRNDNPAKSQLMQQLASDILGVLKSNQTASRSRGNSQIGGSSAPPAAAAAAAGPAPAAGSGWGAAAPPASGGFDDMFGNMALKGGAKQQQQQPQQQPAKAAPAPAAQQGWAPNAWDTSAGSWNATSQPVSSAWAPPTQTSVVPAPLTGGWGVMTPPQPSSNVASSPQTPTATGLPPGESPPSWGPSAQQQQQQQQQQRSTSGQRPASLGFFNMAGASTLPMPNFVEPTSPTSLSSSQMPAVPQNSTVMDLTPPLASPVSGQVSGATSGRSRGAALSTAKPFASVTPTGAHNFNASASMFGLPSNNVPNNSMEPAYLEQLMAGRASAQQQQQQMQSPHSAIAAQFRGVAPGASLVYGSGPNEMQAPNNSLDPAYLERLQVEHNQRTTNKLPSAQSSQSVLTPPNRSPRGVSTDPATEAIRLQMEQFQHNMQLILQMAAISQPHAAQALPPSGAIPACPPPSSAGGSPEHTPSRMNPGIGRSAFASLPHSLSTSNANSNNSSMRGPGLDAIQATPMGSFGGSPMQFAQPMPPAHPQPLPPKELHKDPLCASGVAPPRLERTVGPSDNPNFGGNGNNGNNRNGNQPPLLPPPLAEPNPAALQMLESLKQQIASTQQMLAQQQQMYQMLHQQLYGSASTAIG